MSFTKHERLLRKAAFWSEDNEVIAAIETAIDNHRYQHAAMRQGWDDKLARYVYPKKAPKARLKRL